MPVGEKLGQILHPGEQKPIPDWIMEIAMLYQITMSNAAQLTRSDLEEHEIAELSWGIGVRIKRLIEAVKDPGYQNLDNFSIASSYRIERVFSVSHLEIQKTEHYNNLHIGSKRTVIKQAEWAREPEIVTKVAAGIVDALAPGPKQKFMAQISSQEALSAGAPGGILDQV